jgi:hypothetical protein
MRPLESRRSAHIGEFMADGMAAFFEGKYFWKMAPDVRMPVGPTIIHSLPKGYMEATEKHSAQVKIGELADGGLTLTGYGGGIPFPSPDEPHTGWKILANLWYRYTPHLTVNTRGLVCFADSGGQISCKAGMKVYRQLSFNTDPGVPASFQAPKTNTSPNSKWSRSRSRSVTRRCRRFHPRI